MGLPLWVDVKMHKTAQNFMERNERAWLHGPHRCKKAISNKTNKKNEARKNGRWAYPYGSTSKCTSPPKILWSQRGALGSMSHMAVKRQSATKQIRKTKEWKTGDGLPLWVDVEMHKAVQNPMEPNKLPCNSIPFRIHFWDLCHGATGSVLAPYNVKFNGKNSDGS